MNNIVALEWVYGSTHVNRVGYSSSVLHIPVALILCRTGAEVYCPLVKDGCVVEGATAHELQRSAERLLHSAIDRLLRSMLCEPVRHDGNFCPSCGSTDIRGLMQAFWVPLQDGEFTDNFSDHDSSTEVGEERGCITCGHEWSI